VRAARVRWLAATPIKRSKDRTAAAQRPQSAGPVLRDHWAHEYARRFHSLLSILAEIYLCHTCSCQEILRMETPGQDQGTAHHVGAAGGAGVRRLNGPPCPARTLCTV
jgi:hypothetical protein